MLQAEAGELTLQGWHIFKLPLNTRAADIFVWNCEGCSFAREQLSSIDPPKPDLFSQCYILLSVNFHTITQSRSLKSSKVLQPALHGIYISKGILSPFHSFSFCLDGLILFFMDWLGWWRKEEEAQPHTSKEHGFKFPARHLHQA